MAMAEKVWQENE